MDEQNGCGRAFPLLRRWALIDEMQAARRGIEPMGREWIERPPWFHSAGIGSFSHALIVLGLRSRVNDPLPGNGS
jgi:hypothetical protein